MGEFGTIKDKWVCPNDRELALRAKLKAGWSVKTNAINSFTKPEQLNDAEQEVIMTVIRRAESLEHQEMERVGRLVERLENMKKNALGNGTNQCVLCADEFGLLGASPLLCSDCKKTVCTKCGVDTISAQREPQWLCKICAETREMWKKSGAWFFKSVPKYVIPEKKVDPSRYGGIGKARPIQGSQGRSYASWMQGKGSIGELSEQESTDSSEDDFRLGRGPRHNLARKAPSDSVESTDSGLSSRGTAVTPGHSAPETPRSGSARHVRPHANFSATNSYDEQVHDFSDGDERVLEVLLTANQERDSHHLLTGQNSIGSSAPVSHSTGGGWHSRLRRNKEQNANHSSKQSSPRGHTRQESRHLPAVDVRGSSSNHHPNRQGRPTGSSRWQGTCEPTEDSYEEQEHRSPEDSSKPKHKSVLRRLKKAMKLSSTR